MKKMAVVVIALSLAIALLGIANAGNRSGMGGGCGNCDQGTSSAASATGAATGTGAASAPSEQLRKFQADTIDMRQEMMLKRFEIQRENLKPTPDTAKVAALQTAVNNLQAKILAIRNRSGLTNNKCDGECSPGVEGCNKMSMAGCNKKDIANCGKNKGGCGKGPCGAQK